MDTIFDSVKKFVDESFQDEGQSRHFQRTLDWLYELVPDVDQAMQIAAYAHDIERAFRTPETERLQRIHGYDGQEFLAVHQQRGAEIIAEFLRKENTDEALISDVFHLISKHEVGGDRRQTALKDADSLSFFENNVDLFVEKMTKKMGKDAVAKKFMWMFDRISDPMAKETARAYYDRALYLLRQ